MVNQRTVNTSSSDYIEYDGQHIARLIVKGQWLYDGIRPMPVQVFALNYDYYYDLEMGYHEEGQKPELNNQGEQYVVIWSSSSFFKNNDPSNGYMNLKEAKEYAESVVQRIEWQEPITDNYI